MKKPYIICHMLSALDGKITGEFLKSKSALEVEAHYDRIHDDFRAQAWLCGRVTFDDNFTFYKQADLAPFADSKIKREDFIAEPNAKLYAIALDSSGKLAWETNTIDYNNRVLSHVVEVLCESVSDAYLAYLQSKKVSYIFAGKDKIDLKLLLKKLQNLLKVETLLLEGGGVINGSFLNEGLIDELSLLIAPVADGSTSNNTLFEMNPSLPAMPPAEFKLKSVEKLGENGVWLRYLRA